MEDGKYKIIYGNRRFEACKKLGMKSIEAKVKGEETTKIINIEQITKTRNIRTDKDNSDLSSLMASIRDRGLLEPIGVCKMNEMNDVDFILTNAVENLHREDISYAELGKACMELHEKYNMSKSEISVKLNVPISTVERSIRLIKEIPQNFQDMIGTNSNRTQKDGKLKPTTVDQILSFRFTKPQTEKLLMYTKKNDLTSAQLRLIRRLIAQGNTLNDSLHKFNQFTTINCELSFNKETLERFKKEWKMKSPKEVICHILEGKSRGTPELLKVM